jgi:branched-chain amino acid transport system ATP-binding protein
MAASALQVTGLGKRYGGFVALRGVDITVAPGATHAIIGPNGAGKTTLVNTISGLVSSSSGSIRLGGEEIGRMKAHQVARRGLVRTFQLTSLFAELTVRENLAVALVAARRYRRPAPGSGITLRTEDELLEDFGLQAVAGQRVAWLSHGDQRILEVAVALSAEPLVMLLDEPTAGMSPDETERFTTLVIERLKRRHTLVVVEHDMEVVMQTADHITVMCAGTVLADGTPDAIMADPLVQEAYLGRARD